MSKYTLTKSKGKYCITIYEGKSKPRRVSTGTDDRQLAESIAKTYWAQMNAPKSQRVADLWPSYIADRIADNARADRFKAIWAALEPVFGGRLANTIDRADCRTYAANRRKLGYAPSTVRTELEFLRACLRHHLGDNAPKLWMPPASPPRSDFLTKPQARAVVDAAKSEHIKLFITLGLATGARSSSILDLTWDRVDFNLGTVDFRPAGREITNKRRTIVPMNTGARKLLKEAWRARQSDYVIEYNGQQVGSVKTALKTLSAATGIKVTPHILRHSCAVWMAQANVPMQKISQFLGHTSVSVTERVYARYSPNFMRDASTAAEF